MVLLIVWALGIGHWALGVGAEPVFSTPSGLAFYQVKPDRTKDFELVVKRLTDALRTSADPVRRKQGLGLRIYRASEPYAGSTLYVFVMDPAMPDADYSITRILAEAYPAEVQDLALKFQGACTAQTFWSAAPLKTSN